MEKIKALDIINTIMLKAKMEVIIQNKSKTRLGDKYGLALQKVLMSIGFVASPLLTEAMLRLSHEEFVETLADIITTLNKMLGNNVEHKPMYNNFPTSVLAKTSDELVMDQLFAYYADFYSKTMSELLDGKQVINMRDKLVFDGAKKQRVSLKDKIEYKVINLATIDDFEKMLTAFMASKVDLTPQNKEALIWALENYEEVEKLIPEDIPFKENLVLVAKYAILKGFKISGLKTATDVLRLACAMSDGDITLGKKTKFRKFSRPEKRFLLAALNNVNYNTLVEDVLRRKEEFKKLVYGLELNSKSNQSRYRNLKQLFDMVYKRQHLETYRNKLAMALALKDTKQCVELLIKRPGEFARALDKVLRDADDKQYVIDAFASVAHNVASPTLWKLMGYFANRNAGDGKIIVMPKGRTSKLIEYPDNKAKLDEKWCQKVIEAIKRALNKIYASRDGMGPCFINTNLKDYLIPSSNRTANEGLNIYSRGSILRLKKDTKAARFFIYWVGNDVDLSCSLLNEDLKMIEQVSWTNLTSKDVGQTLGNGAFYHSGDITYAPKGASEFIDLNFAKINQIYHSARYAVMYVFSYSGIPFNKIDDCFAGVMEREDLDSGEIFEAKTVRIKANLQAQSLGVCPMIVDLKTKAIYWADIAIQNDFVTQQVETTLSKAQMAVKLVLDLKNKLPSVYDVLMTNVLSRETLVSQNETGAYVDVNGQSYPPEAVTIFEKPDFSKLAEQYL